MIFSVKLYYMHDARCTNPVCNPDRGTNGSQLFFFKLQYFISFNKKVGPFDDEKLLYEWFQYFFVQLQDGSPRPYTNGSLHHNQREPSPIITQTKDFLKKESTPPSWEDSTPVQEKQPVFSPPKESSQPPEEIQVKTDVPVLKSESRENLTEKLESNGKPVIEEDIVRQVRSSVEKEKATVKVIQVCFWFWSKRKR